MEVILMNLPNNLVQDFVKATKDKNESANEMTVYGVVNVTGDDVSVKLDGSDIYTPVVTSVKVRDGERVAVKLKNHVATIEGNFTSPAATDVDIQEVETEIVNTETRLGQVITQIKNNIIGGAGTGRYELIYKDDDVDKTVPIGFRIYNEDDDDIYWQFDYGGLRFTADGGQNFTMAADLEGNIIANKIAANSVIAEHVEMQDLEITGGSVNIATDDKDYSSIALLAELYGLKWTNLMCADGINLASSDPDSGTHHHTTLKSSGLDIGGRAEDPDVSGWDTFVGPFEMSFLVEFPNGSHQRLALGLNPDPNGPSVSPLYINGEQAMTFYSGTSNGWIYRKYNDGTMEAWRKITPNIAFADSVGTNIKYTNGTTVWDFPSGLIETPVLTATPVGGYQIGVTAKSLTRSSFNLNYYRFSTASSAAIDSYPIHLHIIGRWE